MSPTVKDGSMKFHNALITGLGLINVVDSVVVGREGIGHFQFALINGNCNGLNIILRKHDCIFIMYENGIKLNVMGACLADFNRSIFFVSFQIWSRSFFIKIESPFIESVPTISVGGSGFKPTRKRGRARIGCNIRNLFFTRRSYINGRVDTGKGLSMTKHLLCP